MDWIELMKQLHVAEARVNADAEQVTRLEMLIADFEVQDQKTRADQARALLAQYRDMRALHVAEWDALREKLSRLRA